MRFFALLHSNNTAAALLLIAFAFLQSAVLPARAGNEAALWQAIRSGEAFAIMRHELAPGTGDPNHFQIGDCTTQRNLNQAGRERAAATGERFRTNQIVRADVYTSQWCRCGETAELLNLGEVRHLPALNSFYENYEQRTPRTQELKMWLSQRKPGAPLILVTHQVNILALTGTSTSSGEIVVARLRPDGTVIVLGKL